MFNLGAVPAFSQLILFVTEKNRCSTPTLPTLLSNIYIDTAYTVSKGPLSDQDLNWGNPTCAYK